MVSQFVMVSVAQHRRLVRVSDIQEIVSLMALTEVPEQKGLCRGVVNLRGEIIPVFDLSGPRARLSPSRFILMSPVNGHTIGLIVDDVHDVVAVEAAQIATRPVGGGGSILVVRLEDALLSVLDPAEVLRGTG